jgi:pimeloyl-ACP methyl ester carboxylesterase
LRYLLALIAALAVFVPSAEAGSIRWHGCLDAAPRARCGTLRVPLDRADPGQGTIGIGFELYPRLDTAHPRGGIIASIEGGPGYSTTDDRTSRLELSRPLMRHRDLLLVDLRGTGLSHPLDCRAFSRSTDRYLVRAGRCAAELGPSRDLYDTHQAVEDVADVLAALRAAPGTVDLYGDSYGTYFAQAFAARHPQLLRSVVLDGAYPTPGTDPLFGDLATATQRALRLVCQRAPACAARGEDPVAVVAAFVAEVRAHPVIGFARDADGVAARLRVDEVAVSLMIQSGYWNLPMYRDLLGAIRAHAAGDDRPLLRLAAETREVNGGGADPRSWSEGLYLAVTCHDYPQPWNVADGVAARRAAFQTALAHLDPAGYAPVSPGAWLTPEYEGATACLRWPAPATDDPAAPAVPVWPDVPVLVVNGDLDTITPSADAQVVAARFPHATFVEIANSVHVTALADRDACASRIVRHFVATLAPGDTSCAGAVAPVRVVDAFPVTTRRDRRHVAGVAAATLADAIQRWALNYSGTIPGLRGGWTTYADDRTVETFTLERVRFARDVAVTGTATWRTRTGQVSAHVHVTGPGNRQGTLDLAWSMQGPAARATITGRYNGRPLRFTIPAP